MELCECCKDHQTCDLDKRTKGLTDASCGAFEKVAGLSGEAYQTLKSWRTHPSQPEGTADHARFLSIPMALTEKALWPNESFSRDFYERYLRTDFLLVEKMLGGGDWKGAERLISDEGQGDLTVFIPPGAWRGEHDEIARMVRNSRAVQNDLEAIVRRRNQALGALGMRGHPPDWGDEGERDDVVAKTYGKAFGWESELKDRGKRGPGSGRSLARAIVSESIPDIARINAWIYTSEMQFGVREDDKGTILPMVSAPSGERYPYSILYFLLCLDLVEGQEPKECVGCGENFRPSRNKDGSLRKRASPTCGKDRCKQRWSRRNRRPA